MESRAKLLGHPVHPMLIVLPLGLFIGAVVFDALSIWRGNVILAAVGFWNIAGGVVGGLLAAIFGLIDWLAIPSGTRAKRIGALHGIGNVVVVGLFGVSWLIRYDVPMVPEAGAIVLSALGVSLALVTGWLGGELVDRLGVGVDPMAGLDAPSSLSNDSREARVTR